MQEGSGISLTPAPMGQMQPRQLDMIAGEELRRGGVNAARALGGVFESFGRLRDYKSMTEAKLKLRGVQDEMEVDFKERLQAAPGSARSFYNEDGTRSQEKVDAFTQKWGDKLSEVKPGEFYDLAKRSEWEAERNEFVENSVKRLSGQAQLHELDNIQRVGDATLKECALNDDAGGFAREVHRQVDAGVLTEQEGRLKMLAFGKERLRRGGGVSVGGKEYSGLAAALRAQQARDGFKPDESVSEVGRQAAPAGEWTLGGMPEEVSLKGAVGAETEVATPGVAKDYTLDADGMREAAAERGVGDEWLRMGDFSGVLSSMSQSEVDEVSSLWVNDGAIEQEERADGSVVFSAGSVTAPEAVERVAAVATEQGAINPEAARAMVARMSMDAVTQDGDATAEQICKMFDESGVYEALGDGDAEVGKVRTMQVVHEMVKRGKQGSLVLNNKNVAAAVDAVVNEAGFGKGSEWKRMEGLNPDVEKDEAYKYPKGDAEQEKRWVGLKAVYMKYRDEYNPAMIGTEYTDKEFAEKAQDFWKWYMGGSHKYKDAKAAEVNAARDWYTAKVYEGLLGNVSVGENGKAGYGSYASDVAVMRDMLKQTPPRNLGAEERLKMLERKERDAEARSEKFRRRAAEDYEQLRVMKQEHKEGSEKAQKAKDKAEADERKEQERAEVRRRNVARALPRRAEWGWDGEDDADGEMPACTLPEAEYKRLVEELGYDGTQVVYVQVAGAKLQVTGANNQGRMLLNTAAVAKVQKKPNAKKGERWKYEGNLGYSYYFKNVSANN